MAKEKKERKSADQLRNEITQNIVDAIKNGCPPWRKPWVGGENGGWPINFISKRRYSGINPIILMMSGYDSKNWGTAKQWSSIGSVKNGKRQEWGSHVRKGEKATHVVFFSMIPKKDPKTGQVELNSKGEEQKFPLLRTNPVFNIDQITGPSVEIMEAKRTKDDLMSHAKFLRIKDVSDLDKNKLAQVICDEIDRRLDVFRAKEVDIVNNNDLDFEPAERLIAATGANIQHGGSKAFYRPSGDYIKLPEKKLFETMSDYYETTFHELFHWSENKARCGRHPDHDYAFGELVAELGACFILAELGVPLADKMIESSQGYLNSWLSKMGGDSKYLFKASTQASKVADYLLGHIGMGNIPYEGTHEEDELERAA